MGDPYHLDDATPPEHEELVENTHVTLQDMDSSPTEDE